ncbi:MAG: LEA type 2 family protein [Gammaproteobacteria bacterium]|nr:LEA type 2 family protein [Gammaproteobacteria bacterium]
MKDKQTLMKKMFVVVLMLIGLVSQAGVLDQAIMMPEIQTIKLKQFSAELNSAIFEVEVYNPNSFKLPVKQLSGDILLSHNKVAQLNASSKKSLAAQSTQLFTVPVSVNLDNLLLSMDSVLKSGVAHYQFQGYMMTPVGDLPIEQHGELSNDQILVLLHALLTRQ